MKNKSAQRVKLTSYDDLFCPEETSADSGLDKVQEVPLKDLHSFKNHPFHVLDDEKMAETVESIRNYGVLSPALVRQRPEGGYEMISGHRRKRGSELAGKDTMPVIVRDYSDDEAVVIMVDSNIQREHLLISEKAYAYRMKYEALKHQGSKGEKNTADLVGEAAGDSGRTVQRYIRLTELLRELLDYVDSGKITQTAGEKLSYLNKEAQSWVANAITDCGSFPSKVQAEVLKKMQEEGMLTEGQVYAALVKKGKDSLGVTLPAKKIRSYFPAAYTRADMEEVIYRLLEKWKNETGEGEPANAEDRV